jgi:hypothetical protein
LRKRRDDPCADDAHSHLWDLYDLRGKKTQNEFLQ